MDTQEPSRIFCVVKCRCTGRYEVVQDSLDIYDAWGQKVTGKPTTYQQAKTYADIRNAKEGRCPRALDSHMASKALPKPSGLATRLANVFSPKKEG